MCALPALTARSLGLRYGSRDVLSDANLVLESRERVGLVGRNGSGKSSLAKILAGELQPDQGELIRATGLVVGYLDQTPCFPTGQTVLDAVLAGLGQWVQALERHAEFSARIERGQEDLAPLLQRQTEAAAAVEELGGWDKRHEAASVLGQLGVLDLDAEVCSMSGGEQRRVALARVLVAAPDVAILDEPTNHLDVGAVEWLERWLIDRFRGAVLLVTHDRYLLDRVVSRTLEVDEGRVFSFAGGWARYLEAKAVREAHAERTEANRQNFLRRELEWLRRNPKARGTKQKARIQRIESARDASGPAAVRTADLAVGHVRSGQQIVEAEDVTIAIEGRRLVEGLTLRLTKGERLGIVGPNGCGKTTLLRTLTGSREPTGGVVRRGKNTRIAYLDQARQGLQGDATVFENVAEGRSHVEFAGRTLEVRAYLERFLFSPDDQRQRVGTLSGGEQARVALARTLRHDANVVVLDEPTNDLDVMTLAALEDALLSYPGTVLVATHDRWFLDRVATSLLVFEGVKVVQVPGGWADYVQRRDTHKPEARPKPPSPSPSPSPKTGKLTFAERKELEGLLERVDAAEGRVAQMEARVADPSFYRGAEDERRGFFKELEVAKQEAAALAQRWAELEERSG